MQRLLLLLVAISIIGHPLTAAEDPALTDLAKAKAAHAKEMTALRVALLAAIDAKIKEENERGAGIDYLLKERKGFEENGVTPILPKLIPASKEYLEGRKAANAKLVKGYTVAIAALSDRGKTTESAVLTKELQKIQGIESHPLPAVAAPKVETKGELKKFLAGTVWVWASDGDLHFKADGLIGHKGWEGGGFVMHWEAIDRRTILLEIVKGRDQDRYAILTFSEDLTEYSGRDFISRNLLETKKRKK